MYACALAVSSHAAAHARARANSPSVHKFVNTRGASNPFYHVCQRDKKKKKKGCDEKTNSTTKNRLADNRCNFFPLEFESEFEKNNNERRIRSRDVENVKGRR